MLQNAAKSKGREQKAFQTDDMEIRYDCTKCYYILCMNCANGIIFGLWSVLNIIIFLLICHLLSSITRKIKENEGCLWALWKERG